MSLVNFAIRTCLKRALLGRTLAEERVNDSMITPIPELVGEAAKPLIIVSTDDDESRITDFDLLNTARSLDLVIEIVLAGITSINADTVSFEIPHTDAGMEASLDFVQHGIFRALSDPGNAWAQLFLDFVGQPKKIVKRRGADTKNGIRFAARQLVLTCEPACEPAYGAPLPPGGGFDRFIAALRADAEMSDYADAVLKQIVGDPLPSWRSIQASLGLTEPSLRTLGLAPFGQEGTGEPPLLDRTVLDQQGDDGGVLKTTTGDADGVKDGGPA